MEQTQMPHNKQLYSFMEAVTLILSTPHKEI